jgi:hypothetical protein
VEVFKMDGFVLWSRPALMFGRDEGQLPCSFHSSALFSMYFDTFYLEAIYVYVSHLDRSVSVGLRV